MSRRLLTGLCSFSTGLALVACAPVPPAAPAAPKPATTAPAPPPFVNSGGMWLPSQIPARAAELTRLGLQLDPAQLADPRSSVLGAVNNLNGCSASFVSKDGLVITNHHCAIGALQHNSNPTANLLENGILAKTRADERNGGPAMRLSVLSKSTDVTQRIVPALRAQSDDLLREKELERLKKQLIAECEQGRPSVRCNLTSLYGGSSYSLMETLEIRDIRLVYAPAEGIGNFGGEVDNWRWPRHCGDVAFFRAYVGKDGKPADYAPDNVPYQAPAHLKLATAPLREGDLALVTGYPAETSLLSPSVEMKQIVDKIYPETLAMFDAFLATIEAVSSGDPEVAIKATGRKRGFDNYRTKHLGELEGLRKGNLLEKKLAEDQQLQAFISATPERLAAYGNVLSELDQAYAEQEKTRVADTALQSEYLITRLLSAAYRIARMADERQKPDAEREPSYQDRNVPQLRDGLKQLTTSYAPKLDRAYLKLALQRDRSRDPAQRTPALATIVGADTSDAAIDRALDKLYTTTKLGDEQTRLKLFDTAKPADLKNHPDPIVRLGAKLYPELRAVEERRKRFDGKLLLLLPRYQQALLESKGGAVAPDANGTLRVAYGTIKKAPPGYAGSDIGAFTTLTQMVAKQTGKEPFNAPGSLLAAAKNSSTSRYFDSTLGDVPVDFSSDLHITNGNSGSATLNARGELIGLAFDGTYESVASDWVYLPTTRSIHVDLRFILFLLRDVEHAQELLAELGVR